MFPKQYLAGQGSDSSYLIENYIDFGYIGVAVFSLVIAAFLYLLSVGWSKRWQINYFLICIAINIFMAPRNSATKFLLFLVRPEFWVALVIIALTSATYTRFNAIRNQRVRSKYRRLAIE